MFHERAHGSPQGPLSVPNTHIFSKNVGDRHNSGPMLAQCWQGHVQGDVLDGVAPQILHLDRHTMSQGSPRPHFPGPHHLTLTVVVNSGPELWVKVPRG